MPGLFNPLWLFALIIIPLIRWLHRWRTPLSSWPVSAVFLWEHATPDQQPGPTKSQPDPAWRRRALATALLVIALAGPYWSTQQRVLSVWIDDSLSAFTMENGETRLATMLSALSEELSNSDSAWAEITLRSLSIPGHVRRYAESVTLNQDDWTTGHEVNGHDTLLPVLANESDHWLLTDGASPDVRSWAARVSLDRVIQSGVATENAAVTRIAARRSIDNTHELDVLVSVTNTRIETDTRQLALYGGENLLQTTILSLLPGQTFQWQTQVAIANEAISASLTPGDSLPTDDLLRLSLGRFDPLPTRIGTHCGPSLRHALSTHPSLDTVDNIIEAALVVDCSRDEFGNDSNSGARIRVFLGRAESLTSTPTWFFSSAAPPGLSLSTDWIFAAQWPEPLPASGHRVLLSAAEQPLVVVHASNTNATATVDTVVNLAHPRFTAQAEYAAFVAMLVDLATGRKLLDETVTAARAPGQSVVIPVSIDVEQSLAKPANQAAIKPLSTIFLVGALLLLLLDAALLIRARRGANRE